jgi:hypothetical protein
MAIVTTSAVAVPVIVIPRPAQHGDELIGRWLSLPASLAFRAGWAAVRFGPGPARRGRTPGPRAGRPEGRSAAARAA